MLMKKEDKGVTEMMTPGGKQNLVIINESYFCLKDICEVLGLNQISRVKSRLKEDGVTTSKVIDNLGRTQQANFVNESNLYKVIFQSRKESAERFTDWVTLEVLPMIRKTGSYQLSILNIMNRIKRS